MINPPKPSLGAIPTFILVVAALYFARPVLEPIAVAVLLAFLLGPLVDRLERWHFGRVVSVLVVMMICLCLIGGVGWILENQVLSLVDRLPSYQDTISIKIGAVGRWVTRFIGRTAGNFREISDQVAASTTTQPAVATPMAVRVIPDPPNLFDLAGQYLSQVFGPVAQGGLIIIFATFVLIYRQDLRNRVIRLLGRGRLNLTTQALDDASTRISRYLLMQSAVNLCYGITIALGLWVIGLASGERHFPTVLLWGLLAAVVRFVPYLGSTLGASLPILISLAVFKSPVIFFATIGLFVGVDMVIVNVFEPWLYGSSTGLSVMAIVAAAVFWTWLWGLPGLILSTPITVCLVVMGKYLPSMEPLSVLLSDEAPLDLPSQVYQRLLALDQEEAAEIVQSHCQHHTLMETFTEVLIPALLMAERDRHAGNLSPERSEFVMDSTRDLIEEAESATSGERTDPASASPEKAADDKLNNAATMVVDAAESGPAVVCVPAQDQADELVAMMVAALLGRAGIKAVVASAETLASERIERIGNDNAAVALISAMPPGALSHARYVTRRAHMQFPDVRLVVALWSTRADPDRVRRRIGIESQFRIADSLTQAIEAIRESLHGATVVGIK